MGFKIAIIDPVGIKSGMNHYNTFLCDSLTKLGIKSFIYSNFEVNSKFIIAKPYFGTFFKNKISQTFNFLIGILKSCIQCKINKIDIVIVHVFSTHNMAIMTYALIKLFGFKILTISHDVSSFTNQDNKFYYNLIYNYFSSRIIVHNNFSLDFLLSKIDSKMHSKVYVLKHGSFVNLPNNKITQKSARKALKLDEQSQYILFFGRLKSNKRLDLIIKAMPYIDSSIKLIVAGHSGKDKFENYQSIIDELELSSRMILDINFISEEKRELYFKATNCVVLPYDFIFQSGVLLMSMSYGLPVVASRIPPFEEIIDDGINGILFEKDNIKALAKKINHLMGDKNLLNQIPQKAINHMTNNYSWDYIAMDYIDIIKSL
ncbi:MAG: hypothetical protein CMP64_06385 [Flavobacteriales bacterium]|nr:hypothetical protein [Flavobacteriales bacterium]|tara:strand:- start:1178 stop:2299 length:1122 start_codon:yes stop_codon:yes gene_type:complete